MNNKLLWILCEQASRQNLQNEAKQRGVNYKTVLTNNIEFAGDAMMYNYEPIKAEELPDYVLLQSNIGIEKRARRYFEENNIRVTENPEVAFNRTAPKKGKLSLQSEKTMLQ
ncbi:MAG: hypothetical protein LBG88_04590 [Christensenellaceae bacterium]|nr:hypothetical protein [Christensenellaceae bacterium]